MLEASRERCQNLSEFIREGWPVLEPGMKFIHGWHIDAISEHLDACHRGQIRRLVINIPPGMMKSLAVNVFFPAWVWGPMDSQSKRFVGFAHEESLGIRDNVKCRRLIQSDWYQTRWPVQIVSDQNEKKNFENTATGFRQVATRNITGKRGDYVLIDDPISVDHARSPVERAAINEWMQESLPTRMNDPVASVVVLIMQRVHEDDPTGLVLSKAWGWDHLMLPMRFEPDRRCITSIGFQDPRTVEGELLFPARFPEAVVNELERTMGSFATAGQLQQRPVPREGAMFRRDWFTMVGTAPAATRWVRYWDLAATEEQFGADPAWTAGVKLGRMPDGRFVVGGIERMRAEGAGVRRMIRHTAKEDGPYCEIGFPQDPGQAGKVQAQDMVLMLAGYIARAHRETGDKVTRAEPVAAQAEAGNICVVEGAWNQAFFDELTTFPGSKFKDQVDALSGAFSMLIGASVFGVPEDFFTVEGGPVPSNWGRVGAVDITMTSFNAVWGAVDPVTNVLYVYDAVSGPRSDPAIHARQLASRGTWVPFLMPWEAHGRGKAENETLAAQLAALGVNVMVEEYDFEVAVEPMAAKLASAEIRVFQNATPWFVEYRRLTRDEKDEIDQAQAGIMRATGLIVALGRSCAVTENLARSDAQGLDRQEYDDRNATTGY